MSLESGKLNNNEEWREISGSDGKYFVSNMGNVRNRKKNRKFKIDRLGYLCVVLMLGGKRKYPKVHKLVLTAFIGETPEKMEACHNDGNKLNCALSNLRYDTHKNNNADKIKHGTSNKGQKSPVSKLTNEQVVEIKKQLRLGMLNQRQIASSCGVTHKMISRINRGLNWTHIK